MKNATPPIGHRGGKNGKEWLDDKELQRIICRELQRWMRRRENLGQISGLLVAICPKRLHGRESTCQKSHFRRPVDDTIIYSRLELTVRHRWKIYREVNFIFFFWNVSQYRTSSCRCTSHVT